MLYYLVESILIFICSFNAILSDVIGIIVGHIYYYLVDVLPKIAEIRRWKRKDFLPTPKFMYIKIFFSKQLFGQPVENEEEHLHID